MYNHHNNIKIFIFIIYILRALIFISIYIYIQTLRNLQGKHIHLHKNTQNELYNS